MIRFDILTLFPGMFRSPFEESLLRRARERGLIEVRILDVRDFTADRHKVADDYPFGGGKGMVLKPEPLARAIAAARAEDPAVRVILLSPQGAHFDQAAAERLAGCGHLLLVCGHYEGVDERIRMHYVDEELSIGDYAPPQYTRPRMFEGHAVPAVLLSGNHEAITRYRRREALRVTWERRPDLLGRACLSVEDQALLEEIRLAGNGQGPGRGPAADRGAESWT
ncbi:MAG: tRNA (guanosine(37)-N1)-methyltransferase TrmD [Deltaproteobacteria bacterium]|nr:tRNA (guanosine(37)-N1)-methyltransferase TrmD [Deltaproteobacteria bacterium]